MASFASSATTGGARKHAWTKFIKSFLTDRPFVPILLSIASLYGIPSTPTTRICLSFPTVSVCTSVPSSTVLSAQVLHPRKSKLRPRGLQPTPSTLLSSPVVLVGMSWHQEGLFFSRVFDLKAKTKHKAHLGKIKIDIKQEAKTTKYCTF